jgi:acyl-[acyl-carrier-protein]-phospholipid O-acyltransferase / long-chain-fatty-acid--[acyl-carrier-protein] ligase
MMVVWIVLGVFGLLVGLFAVSLWRFPVFTTRLVLSTLLRIRYSPRVVSPEHAAAPGGQVVVCNHLSFIDGVILMWLLPRATGFLVDGGNFKVGWMKWIAEQFHTVLMSGGPKGIARGLREAREKLQAGRSLGIFPEGAISRTGQVQTFRAGIEKVVKGTDARIVPCYLHGIWGSIFSFQGGKFFKKWPQLRRRRLTLYIGAPLPTDASPDTIRQRVKELEARAMTEQRVVKKSIPSRILRSWKKAGKRLKAADSLGTEVGGKALLARSLALQSYLRRQLLDADEKFVGVLLPPGVAGVAVNAALAFDRRVAVNLNYTASAQTIAECIRVAGIRRVLTSKRFIEKLELQLPCEVVLLEDLRGKIGRREKIHAGLYTYVLPAFIGERLLGLTSIKPDDLITVIFTSGSTGTPKGVMISHANVNHQIDGIAQLVRLTENDCVLGLLPFFHAFGYAVTLWTALCEPCSAAYHFNPLDARQIGNLAEKYKATILLATPTFLRGYMRRIEPEQFKHVDVVIVGAEKMPSDLFAAYEQRFGVRPSEGYGCTEMSPVVSVNIPKSRSMAKHQVDAVEGSVGRPLPGVAAKIVSLEDERELGVDQEGMLWLRGPNTMQGYLNQESLSAEVLRDGWYRTGDMAKLDKDGFIHITGRQSRFSKIGGEMVPHGKVEDALAQLLADGPDDDQVRAVVTAVPDERKGERLVVLHLPMSKTKDELRKGLTHAGLPNLYIPSDDCFVEVTQIPLLGSGKLDLKAAQQIATMRMHES